MWVLGREQLSPPARARRLCIPTRQVQRLQRPQVEGAQRVCQVGGTCEHGHGQRLHEQAIAGSPKSGGGTHGRMAAEPKTSNSPT